MTNATKTTTTSNGTTTQATQAAQTCAQGMNDAFKAGVEANQKMFNTFTGMFNKSLPTGMFTTPVMPTMDMTVAFEKMAKAMNSMVDSNARLVSECAAVTVDAMRSNARTLERTGDAMVAQFTGKAIKPAMDSCKEIADEALAFANKTSERVMKMNAEHAQRVATIIDESTCCKTGACQN